MCAAFVLHTVHICTTYKQILQIQHVRSVSEGQEQVHNSSLKKHNNGPLATPLHFTGSELSYKTETDLK